MLFPARREVFGGPLWKACMVKNELCLRTLVDQFELCNRIVAGLPIDDTPCLNNPLVRHKLKLPSHNVSTEDRERSANLRANLGSFRTRLHALHGAAQFYQLGELAGVCERIINTLAACAEDPLLTDRLRRVENFVFDGGESRCGDGGQAYTQEQSSGDGGLDRHRARL